MNEEGNVEGYMEWLRERGYERRMQPAWDRLDDDDRFSAGGWRLAELPPALASRRLARLADRRLTVRCECSKKLGQVEVRQRGYRSMIFPAPRRAARAEARISGPVEANIMKWRYVCPLRKCGRVHEVRYDKLTLAFILAAEAGRSGITLPVRLPRAARAS